MTDSTADQGAALTDRDVDVIIEAAHPSRPDREALTRQHLERIVAAARADERERIAQVIEAEAVLRDDNSQWRDGMEDAARIAREGGDR